MIHDSLFLILALFGLVIGSFLNALIWRTKTERSIVKGRSQCPDCGHQLAAKDLLPVVSWLWLAGKCRYCKAKISAQYPLVELATGVLFLMSFVVLNPASFAQWVQFGLWLIILSGLIFLAVYDLRWYLLPDKVLLPLVAITAISLLVGGVWFGLSFDTIMRHVIAAFAVGVGFYILASIAGGALLGGGDVKLGFLMGLLLGLRGTLVALFLAFNLAAVVGVGLIVIKLKTRKDYIPFGPFLVLGTIISYLYGAEIINWYLSLNQI